MFNAKKIKDEIVAWIQSYFSVNGPDCMAVIGVSGGKDSSIVAALCCEALGRNRVFGVLMPQGEQADIDMAFGLVHHLDIRHAVINIGETAGALLERINELWPEGDEQARVNTPARIRMAALYAVSACVRGRVANTCNLSEDYVGYSTKFGDSAGDFGPLARLTVTEIKQIGRALCMPDIFIDKAPIDGLCGKTDEENLGFSYAVLDRYIREGVCEDKSAREKIDRLHRHNLHKLQLMPVYEME